MPVPVDRILAEADALLRPQNFDDYCLNGLQVPGSRDVACLATGVSANAELFALAAKAEADLLITHHGLFWGSGVRALDRLLANRLRLLFEADLALAAYHLPLDAHPELGNNALLANALGATDLQPFAKHGASTIGFAATLSTPTSPEALAQRVAEATITTEATATPDPLLLEGGPPEITSIAVVSGAGADYIAEAAAAKVHALITGEPEERTPALCREHGVHVIAAGHHATERFGVRALGEHLAARFGIEHVFIDVPNPV